MLAQVLLTYVESLLFGNVDISIANICRKFIIWKCWHKYC